METTDRPGEYSREPTGDWWLRLRQQQGARLRTQMQPLLDFWTKSNNDWVFNLAGLLAYNLLMSLFPILLVLLAVVGLVLGGQAPEVLAQLQLATERAIPGGGIVFEAVSNQLANAAGYLLALGLVTAAFAGSRLFIVLENCFGVIFQIRGRAFIAQNLMAFGMLALYLVLATIMVLATVIPTALLPLLDAIFPGAAAHDPTIALSIFTTALSALLLFGAIYMVVPNRRMRLREVWPGTLLATLLLIVYDCLFPLYVSVFLHPSNYGAVAAYAVVSLIFFYYLALILLFGAELNAWIAGRRETSGDIAATLHSLRLRARSQDPVHAQEHPVC